MAVMPQFSSPAEDYLEGRISLDAELIRHPAATYFIRYTAMSWREGIKHNALLVIDTSLTPCDGSLVMCHVDGRLRVLRLRLLPRPHLEGLDRPQNKIPITDDDYSERLVVKGVITYIINDARSGEFDDCPVM
ncbi:S24 family peptidase [Escherichia coli]|uniref:HumD family translesion DNA polymerase n=2 Tax=Escherichia coli TaxID=562 RepID=UPI002021FB21|nr:S24 family peptidase [Escherichia coli]